MKSTIYVIIDIEGEDIYFRASGYLNIGKIDSWGDHFRYEGSSRRFYFKVPSMHKYTKAVWFLKTSGIDETYDKESIKEYYIPLKNQAKIIEIQEKRDRLFLYFDKAFKSIISFDEIRHFKNSQSPSLESDSQEYHHMPVKYEKEEMVNLSCNKIVFRVSA